MSKDNKNTMGETQNNILQMAIEPQAEMNTAGKATQGRVTIESAQPDNGAYTYQFTPVADPIGGGGTGQDIANLYNLITNEAEKRLSI